MTAMPTRWRIAGLLFVAAAINYLDRACISIASPAIKQELGIDDREMGLVFSSFFLGYALMNVVGGWAADRFGAKKVLAASLVAWSLFCALTGAAGGFVSLLLLRVLFGAAEGPFGAASATVINRWFSKPQISNAIAAIASGTAVGAIVAGPLVALVFALIGWRGTLIAISGVGVLFAIFWVRYAPGSPPSPARTETESDGGGTADSESRWSFDRVPQPTPATWTRTADVFRTVRQPLIIANALAYFAYTYVLAVYLSWLPLFFTSEVHLRIENAALSNSLPWIMALIGIWAGALLSDFIFRRTRQLLFARRAVQAGAILIAGIGTAALGRTTATPAAAIAIASISLFALYISGTSFWAVVQDVIPSRSVGTVSGFTHFVANVGGVVGPAVMGALVQHNSSYRSAWLVTGAVAMGAAVLVIATMPSRPVAASNLVG